MHGLLENLPNFGSFSTQRSGVPRPGRSGETLQYTIQRAITTQHQHTAENILHTLTLRGSPRVRACRGLTEASLNTEHRPRWPVVIGPNARLNDWEFSKYSTLETMDLDKGFELL